MSCISFDVVLVTETVCHCAMSYISLMLCLLQRQYAIVPCLAFHLMLCLLQRQYAIVPCTDTCVSFDVVLVTDTMCGVLVSL